MAPTGQPKTQLPQPSHNSFTIFMPPYSRFFNAPLGQEAVHGGSSHPRQCVDAIAPLENPPFVLILMADFNTLTEPLTLLAQANMQDIHPMQRDIYLETNILRMVLISAATFIAAGTTGSLVFQKLIQCCLPYIPDVNVKHKLLSGKGMVEINHNFVAFSFYNRKRLRSSVL